MEIFIPSFVLFNFGIGAFIGAFAAGLNLSIEWQIVLFSTGTLMSFFLIRPVMKKYAYRRSDGFKTNIDAMVGRQVKVTEEIDNENNRGRVLLDGDNWQARTQLNEVIPTGTLVEIIQLNSIILIVKKVN
jgi:membrane protein implicated in regulation of membrane protease activity